MTTGILLATFGAVERVDDVAAYYTNIRSGQPPPEDRVQDLRRRYERIGGRSPLGDITRRQAAALEGALAERGLDVPVEVGMKFWRPTIEDGLAALARRGATHALAITSGPYDSAISIGGYGRQLDAASQRLGVGHALVRSWHDAPGLAEAWRERYAQAVEAMGWKEGSFHVLFSCHSLPERVMAWADPYPAQFLAHAARTAGALGLERWGVTYQSAGLTEEPWLGPDILQSLDHLKRMGIRRVLVMPIGFCADHLEILHDLDIEARQRAEALGLEFARAPSLNDSPAFVAALANVVEARIGDGAGPAPAPLLAINGDRR